MKKLILISALILAGCGGTAPIVKPEQVVANRVQYIIKVPPKELLTLPPAAPVIDVDKAMQSDIAQWVADSEERTKTLEDQLIGISAFFTSEQSKLNAQAEAENKKSAVDANAQQAGEAAATQAKAVK